MSTVTLRRRPQDDPERRRVVRDPAGAGSDHCYLCDVRLQPDDKVIRIHEASMHANCYELDIRRGREVAK